MPDPLPRSWINVLDAAARFYALVRPQFQKLHFSDHKHTRYCRQVVNDLTREKLLRKSDKKITYDKIRSGCPVYTPTEKGIELLAEVTGDSSYLSASCQWPRNDRLDHWVAISDTHITLRQAIDRQDYVTMPVWVNEWNKFREDGSDQYFLHTVVKPKKPKPITCSPDAAWLLSIEGLEEPFYLETDLGSSAPGQVCYRKFQGYDLLHSTETYRTRHFPNLAYNDFKIVLITTSRYRRDRIATLMKGKAGDQRWRFAAVDDVTESTILHERIFVDCELKSHCLIKPPPTYVSSNLDVTFKRPTSHSPHSRNGAATVIQPSGPTP